MNDPKRLLDDDTTELERLLLSAVARERPSRSLTRRMRLAIGLAGSLLTLKAAAAVLTVAAVVGGVAVVVSRRSEPPPAAPPRERAVAVTPSEAPPKVSREAPPEAAEPAEAAATSQKAKPAPALPDLRDQMRLLEQARRAVRNGAPSAALSTLDQYRKLYPRGAFVQEASVLRIEALRRSGQHGLAASLARDFIRRHPDSPHVERLSQNLGPPKSKP